MHFSVSYNKHFLDRSKNTDTDLIIYMYSS